jgi:hypothetical protein
MTFDLTNQFIRDYEQLREKAEPAASPDEVKRLQEEVERLEQSVQEKEQEHRLLLKTEAAKAAEELKKARVDFAAQVKAIEGTNAERLDRKLKTAQAEYDSKLSAASEAMESEIARRTQALEEQAKKKIATQQDEMDRILNAKVGPALDHVIKNIEDGLAKLAYVPLGTRVAAAVLDFLILVLASAIVRFGTTWGRNLSDGVFALAMIAVFSLRAFMSPGNLVLGISATHIGPDHRPVGRPGFNARLFCWVLHYGPLGAAAIAAVSDPETANRLQALVASAFDPRSIPQALGEVLMPAAPGLSSVILAFTIVWWSLLFFSVLFSSALHRGTPYFRNTTLVEYVMRVGLKRFSLPVLQSKANFGS